MEIATAKAHCFFPDRPKSADTRHESWTSSLSRPTALPGTCPCRAVSQRSLSSITPYSCTHSVSANHPHSCTKSVRNAVLDIEVAAEPVLVHIVWFTGVNTASEDAMRRPAGRIDIRRIQDTSHRLRWLVSSSVNGIFRPVHGSTHTGQIEEFQRQYRYTRNRILA